MLHKLSCFKKFKCKKKSFSVSKLNFDEYTKSLPLYSLILFVLDDNKGLGM